VWQKALLPVHEQFADVVGKDTIQSIYRTAADVDKDEKAAAAAKTPATKKN
jgi:C4-dicarboxylate-binding protein DctP